MLNLFVESRGERVLFLLSDCGPLNHTIAIAVLLAVFLCDLVKRTLKAAYYSRKISGRESF